MGTGMMVFVQIGESGEAVGSNLFGLAATVHLCIDRQGAATHRDNLALKSDDVTRENRELEVDTMEHKKDRVLCINILCNSKIRAL